MYWFVCPRKLAYSLDWTLESIHKDPFINFPPKPTFLLRRRDDDGNADTDGGVHRTYDGVSSEPLFRSAPRHLSLFRSQTSLPSLPRVCFNFFSLSLLFHDSSFNLLHNTHKLSLDSQNWLMIIRIWRVSSSPIPNSIFVPWTIQPF